MNINPGIKCSVDSCKYNNTNNTDILKATTVEDTSNTDNIYSAINISKFRTCGSGKKYKNCCGKNK